MRKAAPPPSISLRGKFLMLPSPVAHSRLHRMKSNLYTHSSLWKLESFSYMNRFSICIDVWRIIVLRVFDPGLLVLSVLPSAPPPSSSGCGNEMSFNVTRGDKNMGEFADCGVVWECGLLVSLGEPDSGVKNPSGLLGGVVGVVAMRVWDAEADRWSGRLWRG